ncbi:Keratin, type II cytoskeletal 8 [Plecturocebus cupreus]
MSIRVTQKSYKVSTSVSRAFSSHSHTSGPSAHISSSSFSQVGSSSFQGGWGKGYGGASGMGGITTIMVSQRLLSPLNLEVDPNIQATCTQEK